MKYASARTVRCQEPGLTQEQALASLYAHYGDDIRIAGVKRRGDSWMVTFQQKIAEFPPKKDEGGEEAGGDAEAPAKDESPSDEGPSDDGGSEGGPADLPGEPGADGPDGGEKKPEAEILHLLHEIAKALGVGGGIDDKLGPDGALPGPPPPGPDAGPDLGGGPDMGGPAGPPMGGPAMGKKPTKLRPGEVLPSQTPIGSPAFSSKQAATITIESDVVDPKVYTAQKAYDEISAGFEDYKIKQLVFDKHASAPTGVYRALLSKH